MILVVGATGLLGGMITQGLLEQGKDVRVLLRENSPAVEMAKQGMATAPQSLIDAGAQVVYGDLKDPASLGAAVAGVKTVISTANTVLRGGADNFESVDLQGTLNVIKAAESAGVGHFIYMSLQGVDPDHPARLFQIKAICEDCIKESSMIYTLLRPAAFMEVWIGTVIGLPLQAGQPVTLVGDGNRKYIFVSMADVAAYAMASVDNPQAINQAIVISGAKSYTWNEIVQTTGEVVGGEVPVNHVGFDEPVPLMQPDMANVYRAMESGPDVFLDMSETSAKYGIEPTPLSTALERMFGG